MSERALDELPIIVESTLDDLMHVAVERILERGEPIVATKGPAKDLNGVTLVLDNPRARVSRTQRRGKFFSALGELCWYLSGSADLDVISYYVAKYSESAEDNGLLLGAYGPRLRGSDSVDQLHRVIEVLRAKPQSRQAVVVLIRSDDLDSGQRDVPCTCTLQFFIRGGRLLMVSHMRSNDAYFGLPHDVFAFTMIQEIVARSLGLDVGRYTHMVGSLHIYEEHVEGARQFLSEGWQSTMAMPDMPVGDPWRGVAELLAAEEALRNGDDPTIPADPYWADLVRMFEIFASGRNEHVGSTESIRAELRNRFYEVFVDDRLDRIGDN